MRKLFDRAAAEAFANVPTLDSVCYHYLISNHHPHYQAKLRQYFIGEIAKRDIADKHIDTVVDIALVELTYPVPTNGDKYLWSCRDRADCCGMPKTTWHRHKLCNHVNFIIDTIRSKADSVSVAINLQLTAFD